MSKEKTLVFIVLLALAMTSCRSGDGEGSSMNNGGTNPSSLSDHISIAGSNADSPQVAIDDNGNAIITWYQSDGTTNQIYKSEYRNGGWTNPSSLDDHISVTGSGADYPQVAMGNNGNAIITWIAASATYNTGPYLYQIYKSEYRNGSWINPSSLDDYIGVGSSASNPLVAMDNNGNAIITGSYNANPNYRDIPQTQIYKCEYRNGSWTNPLSLSDEISVKGLGAGSPQVAMDNNGNAIVTWIHSDGTTNQIYKSEYRNGSWAKPSSLSDHISVAGSSADSPQVAMDDNGNAIITWYQSDGTTNQIYKSEYRNGGWTNPSSLDDHISVTGSSADYPQVAMDDNGNAIVTWSQSDGTTNQIYKSEYRNGGWINPSSWSDHISIGGSKVEYPQVAMDNNGNAVISWSQFDGTTYQIYKSEYRNGGWINPSSLSDHISVAGSHGHYPQVAMDNNGKAIITWSQFDGTTIQIYKSESY